MTVLFLNPLGTLGGAERSLLDILAVLRQLSPTLGLHLLTGAEGLLVEEATKLGVSTEVVEMPVALAGFGESSLLWAANGTARAIDLRTKAIQAALAVPSYLRRLRRAVSRIKPRLIHSNGLKCHILASHVAPTNCPVLWHIRDFLSTRPVLGRWLRRLTPPPAVAITNSEAVTTDSRQMLPYVRIETVYNGIDTDHFSPARTEIFDLDTLAELPAPPVDIIRIGLVATYARWKGQDLFISAAAEAVRARPANVRFYIVGGPIYSTMGSQFSEAELRSKIAASGLIHQFGLVPFQADLPPVYRGLDVVVHASTRPEPFGRTIVEGMACGRAVVVARAGGAAELITEGHDAIGVEPNDVSALSAAITRLRDNPALRTSLGVNARATAVARFDRRVMGAKLLKIYKSLGVESRALTGPKRPSPSPEEKTSTPAPPKSNSKGNATSDLGVALPRVLFLNPIGNIGGAERVLLTAISGLMKAYPTTVVRVVALADGPLIEAVRDLGAEGEVTHLPPGLEELGDSRVLGSRTSLVLRSCQRLPAMWSFTRRLRDTIARFSPDLVHSNGIKTHLLSRFAVPTRVPLIWHAHDFYGLRPVAGWLLRRSRSRVGTVLAISNAVAADVRLVLPGIRVYVVPNAVDLNRFSPGNGEGAELDRQAGLPPAPPGTVRVGLVSTYARWKGHLTVLDAAARVSVEDPTLPVRWFIVGGPIYQTPAQFSLAELQEAARARGLAGRVGFVPFVRDTVPIYRSLDVVLHASTLPEPFGLTVAEAMACGRATVVSAAGGAAELFTDHVDAVGFAPGNVEQLATEVHELVKNPEMRARLGKAARRSAEAGFDATHYARQLGQVYRSLLADPRDSPARMPQCTET